MQEKLGASAYVGTKVPGGRLGRGSRAVSNAGSPQACREQEQQIKSGPVESCCIPNTAHTRATDRHAEFRCPPCSLKAIGLRTGQ